MRIIGQGTVRLLCKRPNGASPFPLKLKDVYFIPNCTINLVSAFQLSTDSIAFDSEVPCLKAFGSMETLCMVTQTNCHYALDAIPRSKSAFMEQMISNDNYLILDPLQHSLLLWHRRLGHASLRTIRRAVKTSRGIKLTIPSQIKKLPFCEACALGKSQKTISRNPQERASRPGQKLHFDLAGPITPIGIGKVRWFLVMADDYCHWRKIKTLKEKGDAEETFHNMVNWAEAQWNIKTQAYDLIEAVNLASQALSAGEQSGEPR